MKVTINTTEPQSREVDWSKPMLVTNGNQIIQTTGIHAGAYFEGIRQSDGLYSNSWYKSDFTPCTTPVTITFENEL